MKSAFQNFRPWRSAWQTLGLFMLLLGSTHAAEPAPDQSTARYEVDFMTSMIDHHAMAVMMASTCERKATHEELRELCTDIRLAQTQEINLMQDWLHAWYGVSYSPQIKPGDQRKMERMAALPPAEYEIEFMESMIRHHRIAIKEASVCMDRAYHRDLVSLCENIIQVQLDEIRIMQSWLCQWYGICRDRKQQ